MKKNFTIKAILLLLVVALTSGCVKLEVGLKITNSSVDFTYVYGMQKAYLSMMNGEGDPFKDTEKELKDDGFTVEDYSDDKYQGKKAVKKLGSLADLSTKEEIKDLTLSNDKLENIKIFQITSEGFFKTTYKASFKTTAMDDIEKGINTSGTTDLEDEEETKEEAPATTEGTDTTTTGEEEKKEEETTPDEEMPEVTTTGEDALEDDETVMEAEDTQDLDDLNKQLQESMEVTFKDGAIEFEFSTLNMTNVLLVGGGVLLLLIIIVAIIVIASKKKGKVEPAEYADKPIPEVVKDEVVDAVEPTADTPELTPIGEPEVKVEAPATEEAKAE